jgi:hypothetical protein
MYSFLDNVHRIAEPDYLPTTGTTHVSSKEERR